MVVNVLVVIQTDGTMVASSEEMPHLQATGRDENELSRALIESFWGCIADLAAEGRDLRGEEVRLNVHHLGPDPVKAKEMDWGVVMPPHSHQ